MRMASQRSKGAMKATSTTKAPVISLPKEAEHFVIHSDVGTPSAAEPRGTIVEHRRISVSVRRRRSNDVERKSSPGERRRTSPAKGSARFSAVEPSKQKPCSGGRELSPPQEESRLEDESSTGAPDSQKKEGPPSVDRADRADPAPKDRDRVEKDLVTASPSSLRREIDVLRLQVQALKDVQEQTAEIHWKVISNVVEERNLWESRYKEATQESKVSKMDAAISMTPTPAKSAQPETRTAPTAATTVMAASLSRVVDIPKIDLFGARQQKVVTRYTLPSSMCIVSTPEGVATLGRRSPVPQVPLMRTARPSVPAVAVGRSDAMNAVHVRVNAVQNPTVPQVAEEAKLPLDLSKLPTPCRSMAQQARCFVGDDAKGGGLKEKDMVSVQCQTTAAHGLRRCSRCGAIEPQVAP